MDLASSPRQMIAWYGKSLDLVFGGLWSDWMVSKLSSLGQPSLAICTTVTHEMKSSTMWNHTLGVLGRLQPFSNNTLKVETNWLTKLKAWNCWCSVFWGDENVFLKVGNAHQLHSMLANSALHIFENCGHFSYQEQSSAFAKMIQYWVIGKQFHYLTLENTSFELIRS